MSLNNSIEKSSSSDIPMTFPRKISKQTIENHYSMKSPLRSLKLTKNIIENCIENHWKSLKIETILEKSWYSHDLPRFQGISPWKSPERFPPRRSSKSPRCSIASTALQRCCRSRQASGMLLWARPGTSKFNLACSWMLSLFNTKFTHEVLSLTTVFVFLQATPGLWGWLLWCEILCRIYQSFGIKQWPQKNIGLVLCQLRRSAGQT